MALLITHVYVWVVALCAVCGVCAGGAGGARYAFFRRLSDVRATGRRVFGGEEARAGAWPAACALLDRALEARCSCSVLAPRWALTAAHCATPVVAYVQYNYFERSTGAVVPVRLVYSHPEFQAVEQDLGAGMDVVTLRHDIGLVRTRADMRLSGGYSPLPLARATTGGADAVAPYAVQDILGKDIDVLGYGMSDLGAKGEHLRSVQLRAVSCERDGWLHCACALGNARGVCSGDSGGPVLYNGTQVGVTSMGPVECGTAAGPQLAMSVFTELRPYARLVEDTMRDVDTAVRMRPVPRSGSGSGAGARAPAAGLALAPLLACAAPRLPPHHT